MKKGNYKPKTAAEAVLMATAYLRSAERFADRGSCASASRALKAADRMATMAHRLPGCRGPEIELLDADIGMVRYDIEDQCKLKGK